MDCADLNIPSFHYGTNHLTTAVDAGTSKDHFRKVRAALWLLLNAVPRDLYSASFSETFLRNGRIHD